MAQEARGNLARWPAQNFGYRAADVAQLTGMLDEVISELRVAAGQSSFDVSLVATTGPSLVEFCRRLTSGHARAGVCRVSRHAGARRAGVAASRRYERAARAGEAGRLGGRAPRARGGGSCDGAPDRPVLPRFVGVLDRLGGRPRRARRRHRRPGALPERAQGGRPARTPASAGKRRAARGPGFPAERSQARPARAGRLGCPRGVVHRLSFRDRSGDRRAAPIDALARKHPGARRSVAQAAAAARAAARHGEAAAHRRLASRRARRGARALRRAFRWRGAPSPSGGTRYHRKT